MPEQNSVFIHNLRMRFGRDTALRLLRHSALDALRRFAAVQRELRNVPLPYVVERQAASNHGHASIADPVRIPHGVDALDGLSSEVLKERLAGIL
jgi:hypothetical protein